MGECSEEGISHVGGLLRIGEYVYVRKDRFIQEVGNSETYDEKNVEAPVQLLHADWSDLSNHRAIVFVRCNVLDDTTCRRVTYLNAKEPVRGRAMLF